MIGPPRLTLLAPAEPLKLALERLQRAGLDGLPVVENGTLVGVLTRRGAAVYLQGRSKSAGADSSAPERTEGAGDKPEGEGPVA